MENKYYRYVPYHREKEYEALGWQFESPLGLPHACYASLYVWAGNGEPIEPELDIEINNRNAKKENEDN